jgi:5,10-methylene-tetrahydrofolate dehydrogenase/methenyl tetrahydrofolate cyclohydrolase
MADSYTCPIQVLDVVAQYNADPDVHGVLVQLPLPTHVNEERVLGAISLEKDVDGFHPINIGRLAMRGRDPLFVPCTPKVRTHPAQDENYEHVIVPHSLTLHTGMHRAS